MRAPIVPALLIATLLGAASPAVAQDTTQAPPRRDSAMAPPPAEMTIRMPLQVATFAFRGRRQDPDPRLGSVVRYEAPDSLRADVFIYPGAGFDARCDSACAARVLREEVAGFLGDFPEFIAKGYYTSITLLADTALTPPAGAPWRMGRHLRLQVAGGRTNADRSELVLWYLPYTRVKVRATYSDTPERSAALGAFVTGLMPALTTPPTPVVAPQLAPPAAPPE